MDLAVRHTLATLAYRLGKVLRGTPPEFRDFRAGESARTPGEILAHISDLMDWARSQVEGIEAWTPAAPLAWDEEVARFYRSIGALDQAITGRTPTAVRAERLFQGAIADALTHTGQLAMLRRMAGIRMRSENYSKAEIVAGRVGSEQAAPKREFD